MYMDTLKTVQTAMKIHKDEHAKFMLDTFYILTLNDHEFSQLGIKHRESGNVEFYLICETGLSIGFTGVRTSKMENTLYAEFTINDDPTAITVIRNRRKEDW